PAEDGIRYATVTGVQTCALPIWPKPQGLPVGRTGTEQRSERRSDVRRTRTDARQLELQLAVHPGRGRDLHRSELGTRQVPQQASSEERRAGEERSTLRPPRAVSG